MASKQPQRSGSSGSAAIGAIVVIVTLAVAALAGYWFWSPVLTMRAMRSAVAAGDSDAFNRCVDYPRLRQSLKTQLSARIAAKAGAGGFGAVLGQAFGGAVVEALVRPTTLMTAMQLGKISAPLGLNADAPAGAASTPRDEGPATAPDLPGRPTLATRRDGPNRFLIDVTPQASTRTLTLVLERSGFADWKLTDLRIPGLD